LHEFIIHEARIAVPDPEDLPASFDPGSNDGPNCGVDSRSIATARYYSNLFHQMATAYLGYKRYSDLKALIGSRDALRLAGFIQNSLL
jgi:hypothetical protein